MKRSARPPVDSERRSVRRPRTTARARRRRVARLLVRALAGLWLGGVFAASLVAGAVLHVNLPASRRVTAVALGRFLSNELHGEVDLGAIEHLGLRGATLTSVSVRDEAGAQVLELRDVRVRTDVLELVKELGFAEDKLTVIIRYVRAERAEVQVVPDPATGEPTVLRALTPVPKPKRAPSEPPSEPTRPLRVWLPKIEIAQVYARGQLLGLPVLEVALNGVRGSTLITPKGVAVDVSRYGMVVRGLGGTDARGTGDLHVRAPGAVWSSFDGYFGSVPVDARVHVKGRAVTASVDVARAQPEDVRALLPDWPLQAPVSAHAEVAGELPELSASARFDVEGAKLTANGRLRVDRELRVDLDVEGRSVDIRALWPKAPATSVDVDSAVSVRNQRGRVVVDVNGTTAPTTIARQPIPAMDVTGTFDDKGFEGKATVHERGMPLKVALTVHPDGAVDVDARARSFDIARAPRVASLTDAEGRAEMQVKARIEKNRLDATLVADVSGFSRGDIRLEKGRVTGHAKGPLTEPGKLEIDAKLAGNRLAAKGLRFDRVAASAHGPVTRPRVSAKLTDSYGPEVNAKAMVETRGKPVVRNLELQVKREGAELSGTIARLDLDQNEVRVDSLKLTGAGGQLAGTVRLGKNELEVHAKGDGLDLDAISRALGLPRGVLGGRLTVDADVVANERESRGRVRLGLAQGSVAALGGIALSLDATLDGRRIEGNGQAQIEDVGALGTSFSTELAGNAARPSSWKGITGAAELWIDRADLAMLRHVLPRAARVEKISGMAFAKLRVERTVPSGLPGVRVEQAGTRDLKVRLAPSEKGADPVELTGYTVYMSGGADGRRGDLSGTTQIADSAGLLVTATGSSRLDFEKLLAEPDGLYDQLLDAPIMAALEMHHRDLRQLPVQVRPEGLRGSVGGRVTVRGTFSEPELWLQAEGKGITSARSRRGLPVDGSLLAMYQPATGRYSGSAKLLQGGRRVAQLETRGTASLVDGSWSGGANLAIDDAPLALVPVLADGNVAGRLDGTVVLQRASADSPPQLAANVDLSDASVDQISVGSGTLSVRSDGRLLRASAALKDAQGQLDADLRAGVDWSGAFPELDRERPVRIEVTSRQFDAVVLTPFLRDIFSRLTGKVDARVSAVLEAERDREGKPRDGWQAELTGTAAMKSGTLQIAPLGLEFRDTSFQARARRAGRFTAIEITNITAKARSEKINVTANANVVLQGVRVVRGNGTLRAVDVPVLFEGVPQATATGLTLLQLERQEAGMLVTAEVPSLIAKLPEAQSRSVLQLEDHPAIEVLQPLREPRERSTGPALAWHLVVKLGKNVRLLRSDLDLRLSGQPEIDLGPETKVTGFVELEPSGRLHVWGKAFLIEAGRVRFDTPDPTNPHIAVTASWRAPDGSTVYVDTRGTLKESKLTLSSSPARSEQEIIALLFGGSSGGGSDEASSTRSRESATAGGLADAFNAVFADALVGAVELRTATNEDKASYTAAVRLSENVWFEGTYRNRLEAEQSTTSTEPVDVSGTFDWRFRQNWSLRTEVGTLGTGMDLLWQYRY